MMRKLTATGLTALALAGLAGTGAAFAAASHSAQARDRREPTRTPRGTAARATRPAVTAIATARPTRPRRTPLFRAFFARGGRVVAVRARTVSAGQSGSRLPGTGSRPTVTPHTGRRRTTTSVPPPGGVRSSTSPSIGLDELADDREPEARAAAPAGRRARSGRSSCPLLGRHPRALVARRAARPTAARRAPRRVTVVPRGAWSSALATRLSSTWTSRSRPARDGADASTSSVEPDARSSASGRHVSARSRMHAAASTCSAGAAPASERASASSSSTRSREPLRLGQRAARGVAVLEPQPSAVSGVRSSCEASATNSSCERRSCPSFATVSLNDARERANLGRARRAPGARASGRRRRPRPPPARDRASGRGDEARERSADERGRGEHDRAMPASSSQ